MKIEKIHENLEIAYHNAIKDDIKRIQSYKYKAGFFCIVFIGLYFYFDFLFFLVIGVIIFISILANFYKHLGFKEGFKNGYLAHENIDIDDYKEKILDNF